MSSGLLFDSDKELLLALSLTQICNPEMWAKLDTSTTSFESNTVNLARRSNKKTQARDWTLHRKGKIHECLQKWHEFTGLNSNFDCTHDSGLYPIGMDSSLSSRIKCIFEVIVPYVSSCVGSADFCEALQKGITKSSICGITSTIIIQNWLHGLDLRYNPNFHLLILFHIKNNPSFSMEFFNYCFKFREEETSIYNVGMVYDMIPINLRHFMLLQVFPHRLQAI